MQELQRQEYVAGLYTIAESLDSGKSRPTRKLADRLLQDECFCTWPASDEKNKHHHFTGGLLVHTSEVVHTCMQMHKYYKHYSIDPVELFLAALYHDAGKMYDYELIDGQWQATAHKRHIHHITRSVLIWQGAVQECSVECRSRYDDCVMHAILAHHGRREYGSPVSLATRVAWLLHLCDSISARMYDCYTLNQY